MQVTNEWAGRLITALVEIENAIELGAIDPVKGGAFFESGLRLIGEPNAEFAAMFDGSWTPDWKPPAVATADVANVSSPVLPDSETAPSADAESPFALETAEETASNSDSEPAGNEGPDSIPEGLDEVPGVLGSPDTTEGTPDTSPGTSDIPETDTE